MSRYIIVDCGHENADVVKSLIQKTDSESIISFAVLNEYTEILIASEKPDIIFVNLESPTPGTIDLCKKLSINLKLNYTPIIFFGNKQPIESSESLIIDSGAWAFFLLPNNEINFQLQLKNILKTSQILKENAFANEKIKSPEVILKASMNIDMKAKAVIENSTDGILIINDEGIIIEANPMIETITGIPSERFLLKPIWDFQYEIAVLEEKNQNTYELLKGFISGVIADRHSTSFGKLTERKIRRADGMNRIVETTIFPIEANGSFFIVTLCRDITDRKLFEEALKNSESKYHGIFDANKDGITIHIINPDLASGILVEANKAAYEMFGYTKEEFSALHIFDLELEPSDNSQKKIDESLEKNQHISIKTRLRHKSGKIIHAHITIVPIKYNNQVAVMNIVRDLTEWEKVEDELHESEKTYRNLVERLPDGVYKSTHEGKFVEANEAMVKMLGYHTKEELMNIDIKSELYFEPDDRESITLQERYEEMGIFRLRKKDGSEIWVEDHGWYSLDKDGEILFHEGIMRDITERKRTEEALIESEERFKMLFEKAPIGYQSLDKMGYLVDVNETWLELMGYEKEEVIGKWFGNFLTPAYVEFFKLKFPRFKSSGTVQTEFEMVRKNGTKIIVQLEGRIGHQANGTFKQTHCVLSDITERRNTEKAIADERILLKTLIDNIPDCIYVKDTSCRKIISNKADLELHELQNEKDAMGKTDLELISPKFADQSIKDDLLVIQNGESILNKVEYISNNKGVTRCLSTTKIPLRDDSGKIIGLVGVSHDITNQKQREQKIIQLSKGIEQSPASIIITDTLGNIEYVNSKFTEISGYTFEEVKGKNPNILQSGYTPKEEYYKLWNTITSNNEYHTEIQNRKKNGELHWESVLISPIRDENGTIINYMAIKEDITNRKNADLEILKLSVAIEQSPTSVVITDTQGIIEYTNKKFLSISGYSKQSLIGKVLRILKPGHTSDEVYVEIWNKLFAGKAWKGEHQNRTKKNVVYWESVSISPIKNQEGKITNFIVLSENISERKKMEKDLISAKEKAEESDRLKSAFLANMSHEIRTPLNSILGFSDLLNAPELDHESRIEYVNLINSSGNNLLTIINDILDISKIEAGQISLTKTKFSAQNLISKIQKEYLIKAVAKGIDLRISNHKTDEELIILSDESRIKQVLINFVGNALKFTDKGHIEIGVNLINNCIQFHVKDTGIGISKDFHDKIFDRFRQVEAAQTRRYGGNGLGLAITKNLAELLGGKIHLKSRLNVGSTFFFTLPEEFRVND